MATTSYDDGVSAAADRANALHGIEPLDALQDERARYVAEAAPLRALRDVFDARRKEFRNRIAALIRAEQPQRKFGVQEMEDVASGDARYRAFLDDCEAAFARLAVLDDKIEGVTKRVNRGQALLRYVSSEPRG